MAITFPDPDVLQYPGLAETITAAGHSLSQVNGAWVTDDEAAVQAIINAYDVRVDMRNAMILGIKTEGLSRINAIFPAIDTLDELQFYAEFWSSIKLASKSATVNFQRVIDIYAAAKSAIISINQATTKAAILGVTVNWPA